MITAIRELRRAKRLTLEDVANRCEPPTTAQTIGRLETGTRTVSLEWLNRIARAMDVEAADLVRLPDRLDLSVAAILDKGIAAAPRKAVALVPPRIDPELVAISVRSGIGDYRAGDTIWCRRLAPPAFVTALNRDVLVPQAAGRFAFGRLIGKDGDMLHLSPLEPGTERQEVPGAAWIAVAERLIRTL